MSQIEIALQEMGLLDRARALCEETGQTISEILEQTFPVMSVCVKKESKEDTARKVWEQVCTDPEYAFRVLHNPLPPGTDFELSPEEVREFCRD